MPTDVPRVTEKTSGPTVKQFSVFLQNKVGALLEVVKLLNANEVARPRVEFSGFDRFSPRPDHRERPGAVESLFDLHEIAYSISEILVVEMKEVATDLKRMLQGLLMAEVNIQVCYPILIRPHGRSAMALHLDDLECGWSVLAGEGFSILSQADLSR